MTADHVCMQHTAAGTDDRFKAGGCTCPAINDRFAGSALMGRRSRSIRRRREAQPASVGNADSGKPIGPLAGARGTILVLVIAGVLVVLAYANALHNGFVYDDEKQILANPLIQQPHLLGRALTSDVWAFSGRTGEAWSNYWRPVFVAWMSLHYALFGAHPMPWHATTILLHLLATVLGFLVLRTLGFRTAVCAATTWLFAVVPSHVESVSWISGAPDAMCTCLLFAACLCQFAAQSRFAWLWRALAPCLFGIALLTKETAIVFPAIVFVCEWVLDEERVHAWRKAARATIPYLLVFAAYLVLRVAVVGLPDVTAPDAPGIAAIPTTAPELLWFYVRHVLAPFGLSPSYALKPVSPGGISWSNFALPLAAIVALGVGVFVLCRRDRRYCIGIAWFVLPLLPVLDVHAFVPEDIVHDRYLYLSAFGALTCLVSLAAEAPALLRRRAIKAPGMILTSTALLLALALVPATRAYNRVWANDIALWQRGVQSNPNTALPHLQLGDAYRRRGELDAARIELQRALILNPGITNAHIALAALDRQQGRLGDAEYELNHVLEQYPDLSSAIELLGMVYQAQGRLNEAIALYEHGRRVAPFQRKLFTVNLAVLQRLAGRSDLARRELESLGPDLGGTRDPKVMRAWFYLAELDREAGRDAEATTLYRKYLAATSSVASPDVQALRRVIGQRLRALQH